MSVPEGLSLSAWAAITKYHRLHGLNNRHLFLKALEAGKCKISLLADSVPGEGPFLFLANKHLLLCPHKVERVSFDVSSSSYKGINPNMGATPSRLYPNLITSPNPYFQMSSHWGGGDGGQGFNLWMWGGHNIQSITQHWQEQTHTGGWWNLEYLVQEDAWGQWMRVWVPALSLSRAPWYGQVTNFVTPQLPQPKWSLVPSPNILLSSYYVPDNALGAKDETVNETGHIPALARCPWPWGIGVLWSPVGVLWGYSEEFLV